jgi:hypothetical protein
MQTESAKRTLPVHGTRIIDVAFSRTERHLAVLATGGELTQYSLN